MDALLAHLSSERHYMGSAAAGRYCTDRSVRPFMGQLPTADDLARRGACRDVWRARYLREQDVVGWVLEFADAKEALELLDARIAELEGAGDEAVATPTSEQGEPGTPDAGGSEGVDGGARPEPAASGTGDDGQAMRVLMTSRADALARKREASRQLRMFGISPKAQAAILSESRRREETLRERYLAARESSRGEEDHRHDQGEPHEVGGQEHLAEQQRR
jgi:hypothetical protein